ncbi:asparagine synthase (glutamine-hydrolyzing) [Clostridiaceae bacterium 35-E11]
MSGIIGMIAKNKQIKEKEIFKLNRLMIHRGPDGESIYVNKNVAIAYRKLLITHSKTQGLPIYYEDRKLAIVWDGTIYNSMELRKDLMDKGHVFYTDEDTEILICGYKQYGINIFDKINGMFAIAIYDMNEDAFILARDRFGEKPLYYYDDQDQFIFASELKSILACEIKKDINIEALNQYLTFTYIPAPNTIFKNAYKLEPGYCMKIIENSVEKFQYYSLSKKINTQNTIMSFNECKENLRKILMQSVRNKMISDVPVGAFLSGGIDSSIIVGIMSRLFNKSVHTFSIGFNVKEYDESRKANEVAKFNKTNPHRFILNYDDTLDILDRIIMHFDEPFADASAIPTYFASKLAGEKVKVVLTGDGADQIFAGSNQYLIQYYRNLYDRIPKILRKRFIESMIYKIPHHPFVNSKLRKVKRVIRSSEACDGYTMKYEMLSLAYQDQLRQQLLSKKNYKDIKESIKRLYEEVQGDPLIKSLHLDTKMFLEGGLLTKVDRMSMLNSIEKRSPFLDKDVVELSFKIPSNFKLNKNKTKYILKETFKDILPPKIIHMPKHGFNVPVGAWLKGPLKEELLYLTSKETILSQDIFNYDYIHKTIQEHLNNNNDNSFKLWTLYVFQKWYYKNFL